MALPTRPQEVVEDALPAQTIEAAAMPLAAPDELDGPDYRRTLRFGVGVLIAFFVGFVGWAALAPLDSAAIAPGQLFVSGNRKQVQHLEGGIVRKILVAEGATVAEGDPIMELDPTQADADLGQLQSRLVYAVAREARLKAERAGDANISFPAWLAERRSDPEVSEALRAEETALKAARDVQTDQIGIWESRVRQLEEESNGLRDEIRSTNDQLGIIGQEIADQKFLVERGLGIRRVLLGLERQATEIRGRRARARSGIARNEQAIGESKLRITELQKARLTEIDNELGQLSSEIGGLSERINAAKDVQDRTVIRAPVSGQVVNLQAHTIGGVVRPGDLLMEVVPVEDALIVVARVSPADIDVVRNGLAAQIRLSAYPGRTAPVLDATVDTVSADLLNDERTGVSYYEVRVSLPADDPQLEGLDLYPGMPAEVSIVTGEQTFMNSLIRPLTDTVRRGVTQN